MPYSLDGVLQWALVEPLGRQKVALVLLCAVAIAVLADHLTYRLLFGGSGRPWVCALGRGWLGTWIVQAARLLYYVGIPAAVLWRDELLAEMGIPTTRVGGEKGLSLGLFHLSPDLDVVRVAWGLAVGFLSICLLVAMWAWYARAAQRTPPASGPAERTAVPWWQAVREALFCQLLWAFYRAAVGQWTGDRVYVAFLSLWLIAVPWLLSPLRRHRLWDIAQSYLVVQDWVLAVLTAYLSLNVDSLLALVLLHALWLWAGGWILSHLFQTHLGSVPVE